MTADKPKPEPQHHTPKQRKPFEWVQLPVNTGFVSESHRLRVQILPENYYAPPGTPDEEPPPCMGLDCDGRYDGREWSNVLTEPDPQNGGRRHNLCHVCECRMMDCTPPDNVVTPPAGSADQSTE